MASQTTCPSPELIEDLLANRLPAGQADEVRQHVATCANCQQRLGQAPASAAIPKTYPFLAPPEGPRELGQLGPYRIKGVLGEGGMAVVFDAEDTHLQRQVALKVLQPDNAGGTMRERFLREARALASLPSDHVVHVYQVGEEAGVPFIAMEKLRGESLESRLTRDRTLSVAEALTIAREAAEGLAVVHDQELVHRDIKPSNLWLEEAPDKLGRVKLIDFGIARPTTGDSSLTLSGHAIGTPTYMAPEQAAGQPVDGRADLYGLGCVLYRMITGRTPFDPTGPSTMSLLQAIITGNAPDVREQAPFLSAPVAELIQRLLGRQPADRPASARAVVEELRRLEESERTGLPDTRTTPVPTAPHRPPRRAGLLGILLGSAVIFAALVVGAVAAYRMLWPGGAGDDDTTQSNGGAVEKPPVNVGFLFSLTGPVSIHEQNIPYAAHLAVEEINEAGGVLGRKIRYVDADGASVEAEFARQAERLLADEGVEVIFGCWTSASRKRVAEVCGRHGRLLFFPCSYEALEESPHVVYLGGTPNQTVIPLVRYAGSHLEKHRFFLVGTEAVYSHALHKIIRRQVVQVQKGEVVGDEYLRLGSTTRMKEVVAAIKEKKADFIINSMDGSGNLAFRDALREAGIRPADIPTAWLTISEPELSLFLADEIVGAYSAACYFESLDLPSNRAFVKRLRERFVPTLRVNDPMETTYAGIHLWAKAVKKADSFETKAVREALRGMIVDAPEGPIRIDAANLHAWRTARVGRVVLGAAKGSKGGTKSLRFEIVDQSPRPLPPEVFPKWESRQQWEAFLHGLYLKWGKAWEEHP